ncbi:hypothetical protein [Dyadobacter psychrotolerans]|uniref:Lipocalin-like domain-containing protein n=1 Tax=Dyadobacter psychrotolerans TaxID=2541721 RepID=A0A4R5DRD7_9BACT|nr:hypothetical protein [Dyadobacter psychrotolerans]TDE14790.1 hypothetical protein E0F88_16520 [Dyadobacter psychrotolerans]
MSKWVLIPALLLLIVCSGCKENEPTFDFNISATTWKGNHTRGSSTSQYTLIFIAGGNLEGNLNLNGLPQKITGTWTQDKNKVSANYSVQGYTGTWRGEGAISDNKTEMQFKAFHSTSTTLDYTMNVMLQ